MVAELDILSEWIPEQMQPGTIFVLENAGRVGEKEDPYWAVLSCPICGILGLITRKQIAGLIAGDLRFGQMFRAILHSRQRYCNPQAVLSRSRLFRLYPHCGSALWVHAHFAGTLPCLAGS